MLEYKVCKPEIEQYIELRKRVGFFDLTYEQAKRSLDNAIITETVYDGERLVGMGRLIGDGAVICYVQDMMVDPDYQGRNIGHRILSSLTAYAAGLVLPGTKMLLGLMSVSGTEGFYEKCGFIKRPSGRWGAGLTKVLDNGYVEHKGDNND